MQMHVHGAEEMKSQAPSLFPRKSVLHWNLLGGRGIIKEDHGWGISLASVQVNAC